MCKESRPDESFTFWIKLHGGEKFPFPLSFDKYFIPIPIFDEDLKHLNCQISQMNT